MDARPPARFRRALIGRYVTGEQPEREPSELRRPPGQRPSSRLVLATTLPHHKGEEQAPEDERELSVRILRHYASSVNHRKYYGLDIIAWRVEKKAPRPAVTEFTEIKTYRGHPMEQRAPAMEVMPEDWQRALAIAAHPDDLEYGAASAVAKWTGQGRSVSYLMVSRGEAGIDTMHPSETGPLRAKEEEDAARVVGVDTVEFLDYSDGVIEYGLPLRLDLSRAIRRHRPEVILTLSHHLQFPTGNLNMADHRNVGLAVFDAARDAGNRWIFQELTQEGLQPWNGVRFVAVFGSVHTTHAVDITGYLDSGIESLRQHRLYLEYLGPEAADGTVQFLINNAAQTGEAFGSEHAVPVELVLIN